MVHQVQFQQDILQEVEEQIVRQETQLLLQVETVEVETVEDQIMELIIRVVVLEEILLIQEILVVVE